MKDEINQREVKVRWAQNKLKCESESHQVLENNLSEILIKTGGNVIRKHSLSMRKALYK